jgi:hypothetical protein
MNLLLYKEFRLAIHPLFGLVSLFGLLLLIPHWPYPFAMMYIFYITVPNAFVAAKAQNDLGFTVMLPVRKRDVVGARVVSFATLEVLNVLVAALVVAVKLVLHAPGNFLMDANLAFLGATLAMYGLFNLVFFPMFYRTAYKLGIPLLVASFVAAVFAFSIEAISAVVPGASRWLDGSAPDDLVRQLPILAAGILAFAALTGLASTTAGKRFERLDL